MRMQGFRTFPEVQVDDHYFAPASRPTWKMKTEFWLRHSATLPFHQRAAIRLITEGTPAQLPSRPRVRPLAFTLIELLVVIAVIALLAALLLPVLSKAKGKGQSIYCLNNVKQMQLAWLTYTDDNQGIMPWNLIASTRSGYARNVLGSWVLGSAWSEAEPTNITSGTLYQYVGSARTYLCPADPAKTVPDAGRPVPVNRSYATQSSLHSHGAYFNSTFWPAPYMQFSDCVKLSAIQTPGPAQVWGFIEPSAAGHDIASWDFLVDALNVLWAHQPTDRHSSGCNLSFLDGHVEHRRWKAPHEMRGGQPDKIQPGGDREDYNRLLAGVPRNR
jgi:prepilin-type processing-associated H-X9-DG protein/prepilin-type N-terminal cleavage/methylation domain-containing protein